MLAEDSDRSYIFWQRVFNTGYFHVLHNTWHCPCLYDYQTPVLNGRSRSSQQSLMPKAKVHISMFISHLTQLILYQLWNEHENAQYLQHPLCYFFELCCLFYCFVITALNISQWNDVSLVTQSASLAVKVSHSYVEWTLLWELCLNFMFFINFLG